MKQLILSLWSLLPLLSFSQEITGAVKDTTGAAVSYASVTLRKMAGDTIVAFTTTGDDGSYHIRLPANAGALYLEVRSIGYRDQTKAVEGRKIDFTLHFSIDQLQDVVVTSKRPYLKTSGDTISYKVSDFTNPQDRVIGDVIKKLPGIAIASDGTISYNNKPISALYLGGDNLLDDRYSIAVTSIPQGVVGQVQVIDNDQHIKVLQGKLASNEVALNLVFKDAAKLRLFGQESAGAGLPGNYDANLNAMLFNAKYKALNEIKANNTGYDLQRDLIAHNASAYQQRIGNDLPASLLSLGSVNNPDLARSRYLFNRAVAADINDLINLSSGWQFRVNAFYVHDRQQQDYSQNTSVYLPGDTVDYTETQHNRFNPHLLHAQFNLQLNRPDTYFSNTLVVDENYTTALSALRTNGTQVNQSLSDHLQNFSNELSVIKSTGAGHIIQAYTYISHLAEPESRTIGPNYQPKLFNQNIPYDELVQTANVPTWYTNNYMSYTIPGGLLTQSFRAGFSLQSQSLNSSLTPGTDSTQNHLGWKKRKVFAEAAYDMPGERWQGNLTLPLSLQQIAYGKTLTRLYFNPALQLKYKTNTENYLSLQCNYRNEAGTIEDIYQGSILRDYRTLYANSADLTLRQHYFATAGFTYRKALKLFFWNISVSYDYSKANNISASVISNNLQKRIVLPYANNSISWTAEGTISKYVFALNTTFSGNLQWQTSSLVTLQNNRLLPFRQVYETAGFSTDTKVSNKINFSYRATLVRTNSYATRIGQLQQQAVINYIPAERLQFKLSGEHYETYGQNKPGQKYFFADASVKYLLKKNTNLELTASNFLNVQTYNALYLAANTLTASSYSLPGRIILLKVLFNL
jgi:hypothetical protein